MDLKTGEIYKTEEIKEEDLNTKAYSLTSLTDEEHEAMLNTPEQERPSDLAWLRYKAKTDFTDVSQCDLFTDGFKSAKEIYTAVEKDGGDKARQFLKEHRGKKDWTGPSDPGYMGEDC